MQLGDGPSTRASDGSQGIYAAASGLVGSINSAGAWYIWIPNPGIVYESTYYNASVGVVNNGDGTYTLSQDGVISKRRYDARWSTSPYWDAWGNPIATPAGAVNPGDPAGLVFTPGALASAAVAPDPTEIYGRASTGQTDVYASASGLIGRQNQAGNWFMNVPPAGVDFSASYYGQTLSMRNLGDGTYTLSIDAEPSRRFHYDPMWSGATYFDVAGRPIAQPADAIPGDVQGMFFTTGDPYSAAPTVQTTPTVQTAGVVRVQPASPAQPIVNQSPQPATTIRTTINTAPGASISTDTGRAVINSMGPNTPASVVTARDAVVTANDALGIDSPLVEPFPGSEPVSNVGKYALIGLAAFMLLRKRG